MGNENSPRRRKREKGTEEILETIMTDNFPKSVINIKPQIQEAHPLLKRKSPENLPQIISSSNFRKSKTNEKSLKKPEKENTIPIEKQRE